MNICVFSAPDKNILFDISSDHFNNKTLRNVLGILFEQKYHFKDKLETLRLIIHTFFIGYKNANRSFKTWLKIANFLLFFWVIEYRIVLKIYRVLFEKQKYKQIPFNSGFAHSCSDRFIYNLGKNKQTTQYYIK